MEGRAGKSAASITWEGASRWSDRVISVLWLHETERREAPGIYRATRHEAAINELARDGWELVTVTYLPDADRAGIGRIMMFFRRPLPAAGPS